MSKLVKVFCTCGRGHSHHEDFGTSFVSAEPKGQLERPVVTETLLKKILVEDKVQPLFHPELGKPYRAVVTGEEPTGKPDVYRRIRFRLVDHDYKSFDDLWGPREDQFRHIFPGIAFRDLPGRELIVLLGQKGDRIMAVEFRAAPPAMTSVK